MLLPGHLSSSSSTRSATSSFPPVTYQIDNFPSPQIAHQISSRDRRGKRAQSLGVGDINGDSGAAEHQELGTMKSTNPRAKWSHQMKLFLIELLKDHDVSGFRTQNAWSKEVWTNIVCRLNQKFCMSLNVNQVKQKEQDLKKDYRSVKDLMAESGFGWDSERMMVEAPPSVWASFTARNNKDALQWRDKSFPYFDDLASLYDGRYAEGRTRHGMDYYANKPKHGSQPTHVTDVYDSPSPPIIPIGESNLHFSSEEVIEEANPNFVQHTSTRNVIQTQPTPQITPPEKPESRRRKKQKNNPTDPTDGFHERYLKLKMEEIERFAAIEEKKLEDPFSIHKCITAIERLEGLPLGDMLLASDIFKSKESREVFLSFSTDALRLAWIRREIARSNGNNE